MNLSLASTLWLGPDHRAKAGQAALGKPAAVSELSVYHHLPAGCRMEASRCPGLMRTDHLQSIMPLCITQPPAHLAITGANCELRPVPPGDRWGLCEKEQVIKW